MKSRQDLGTAAAGRCLGNLVSVVRAAVRRQAGWAETADLVADQLRLHLPGPEILTAEQRYGDPAGYRCHLLHGEPDGSFSVTALVWRPGQATPIHDHVTWCVFGVIQGAEHEERYVLRDDGWLEQDGVSVNAIGEVAGLAPPGDIHRVRNAGRETEVVDLPPGDLFEQVRVGSAAQRCRYEGCVLELCVLPAAECAFGQEPLADPLQRQRVSAAGAAPVKRIGGETQEHFAGEGVVARMQLGKFAQQLDDVCAARQPV